MTEVLLPLLVITVTVDAPGGFNPDLTYGTVSDFDGNTYRTIQREPELDGRLKVIHYADGSGSF